MPTSKRRVINVHSISKIKQEPLGKIKEFRVSEDNFVEKGKSLAASHFVVGQFVDVKSDSIGKGFAGAMKRHNFAGLRASHGVSISHRSHGSTGQCQDPGKVFKGKKMAGQLGNKMITTQNLTVARIDEDKGLVYIKGSVPGSNGSYLSIRDALKKNSVSELPFPAGIKKLKKISDEISSKPNDENKENNSELKDNP